MASCLFRSLTCGKQGCVRRLVNPSLSLKRYTYKANQPSKEPFPNKIAIPEEHGYVPTLSPPQVTSLFEINEIDVSGKIGNGVIKCFSSNQLPSNHPPEDRRTQAELLQTKGILFAVFDGHAGCACAQALNERLFDYIAVALLPPKKLEKLSHAMKTDTPMDLLKYYKHDLDYVSEDMITLYRNSLQRYVVETISTSGLEDHGSGSSHVVEALISAFQRLDMDMSSEAMPQGGALNMDTLEVALSGSCACVAHVDGINLHVANVGDARAVLGQLGDNGQWSAKPLSFDHNSDNENEVKRLREAHPTSESSFVIKNKRLLGQLLPLRAFGDVRYKWSSNDLKSVVSILDTAYASSLIPLNYYTPPYLDAIPEVIHHKLGKKDKFLILATDGLWDMLSTTQVVELIGKHIEGKQTADNFKRQEHMSLNYINSVLKKRKSGLAQKSIDTNAATHLIRHALGYEHRKVSEMLTLPTDVSRYYRDDISVSVIYFDETYLEKHGN